MTVSQFLDLAYTTLVEEYIRLGSGLIDALERTKQYARGYRPEVDDEREVASPPPSVQSVEEQNNASLMELQALMSGVSGGFG